MRKIKLQMQVSVDGFVAGENGEMDWMTWDWDEALLQYVKELTAPVDTIILGRVLAQGFIPHWSAHVENPETADAFGQKMVDTPKVVFSKTLQNVAWERTTLASGDLVQEIAQLKQQPGQDIIVYGGSTFVSNLIRDGLIDELFLFVNPCALGSGMTIFKGKTPLKLAESTTFDCGIVVLKYIPN